MASFKIPKGRKYTFAVTVLEKDSYLPKDLTFIDVAGSSFKLVKLDDLIPVVSTATIVAVPDDKLNPADPDSFANGRISVTLPSTMTTTLAFERGGKVDGYYYKPTYQGILTVKFVDGTADILAVVPNICVVPTGE